MVVSVKTFLYKTRTDACLFFVFLANKQLCNHHYCVTVAYATDVSHAAMLVSDKHSWLVYIVSSIADSLAPDSETMSHTPTILEVVLSRYQFQDNP